MYSPLTGRFLTRDSWQGDYNRPLSLNRWNYGLDNPSRYTDPSGHIYESEAKTAWDIMMGLKKYQVNIVVDWGYTEKGGLRSLLPVSPELIRLYGWGCLEWDKGEWSLEELNEVKTGVEDLNREMKGKFVSNMGNSLLISQEDIGNPGETYPPNVVKFWSDPRSFNHWTVVHEFAHVWDLHNWKLLSLGLEYYTGGFTLNPWNIIPLDLDTCDQWKPGCNKAAYYYGGTPPKGSDINFNKEEDFAESVATYLYSGEAQDFLKDYFPKEKYPGLQYSDFKNTPRGKYVEYLLNH